MDTRLNRSLFKGVLAGLGFLVGAIATPVLAATFNLFQPTSGILVGNPNTYVTTAATASTIVGLFSGCSGTQYLGADTACHAAAGGITGLANPTGSVGLTAVNGTAVTAMRSDGAPALSQAIAPTWTASHIFSPASGVGITVNGVAASPAATFNGNATSGSSQGVLVKAGTTSADFAWKAQNQTGVTTFATLFGDGGLVLGAANGGDKGIGTINMVGCFIGGVACSAGGGSPGGASTTLQYNNGGAFGGTANLTFNSATGGLTLAAPISGNAFTLTALNNSYGAVINGGATASQSLGLQINAGTNGSDWPLIINNQANTATLARVFGTGAFQLGWNGTANVVAGTAAGNVSVATPASGIALTVNGVLNGVIAQFNGTGATSGSFFDINDASNSVIRGYIGYGSNTITGSLISDFDIAPGNGGRVVIGNTSGGTINSIFGSTGGLTINAPTAAATALSVGAIANSNPLIVTGAANTVNAITSYLAQFNATSGSSGADDGVIIQAGAVNADISFYVRNQSGGNNFQIIRGDGSVTFGTASTSFGLGGVNANTLAVNNVAFGTHIAWANVNGSAGCALLNGQGFGSCTRTSAGIYTLSWSGANNSACQVTNSVTSPGGAVIGTAESNSTTANVKLYNTAGTNVDGTFSIFCQS